MDREPRLTEKVFSESVSPEHEKTVLNKVAAALEEREISHRRGQLKWSEVLRGSWLQLTGLGALSLIGYIFFRRIGEQAPERGGQLMQAFLESKDDPQELEALEVIVLDGFEVAEIDDFDLINDWDGNTNG